MKWNKLYKYPKSKRELLKGDRHYDVNDEKLPSVTTILQTTQDAEKVESLQRWTSRVGQAEADRIKNVAAKRGTAMHSYLETYIQGGKVLDLRDVGQEASGEAWYSYALVSGNTYPRWSSFRFKRHRCRSSEDGEDHN